jgi:ATP-dependent Lhr-like helicase
LRRHEPDHVLLRATRAEAAAGLTDIGRIATLLARVRQNIRHIRLDRVSPLAVPALIEEGREWVAGGAEDALLAEAAALVHDATDGTEMFFESLAMVSEDPAPRPRRETPQPLRRNRFIRAAPKAARR